jgi:inhibitor of KinA
LLVRFDPLESDHAAVESLVLSCLEQLPSILLPEPALVEIPVCYGGDFGPDLADVASLHNLSSAQVIELHASTMYTVYFLGFVPGFAYLGDLPEQLITPRLPAPRKQVPRGSVGIAGNQTGVYPCSTPGGWRLIGRTAVEIFRPDRAQMSLLSIGDRVRFLPMRPK